VNSACRDTKKYPDFIKIPAVTTSYVAAWWYDVNKLIKETV